MEIPRQAPSEFAKAVAPPDTAEHYRVLEKSLLTLKVKDYGEAVAFPGGRSVALKGAEPLFTALRKKVAEDVSDLTSLRSDPIWQKNFRKWLNEKVIPAQEPLRVIGGVETAEGEFPDCVAVGSDQGFCCSGTLISKDLVVTAAHCIRGGCASRIYIGNNSNQPITERVFRIRKAVVHPAYNLFNSSHDIALLVLEKQVPDVTPRQIASSDLVNQSYSVRLVGFGISENGVFGVQFKVDTIVASNFCGAMEAQQKYGCNADWEIVAGGLGADSCNGDSGGPAYVLADGRLFLAGATSRATRNSIRPCGDGGVYTRVDRYVDWIRKTALEEKATFD